MKTTHIVIMILVAVIALAGGFVGGMQYQKTQSPAGRFATYQNGGQRFGSGGGFGGGRNQNFRPVMGEILSSDDKSITVKMQDGSSKIVVLSSSTSITKSTSGSKTDLTTGTKVLVIGTTNSDGSVTAQEIQLNPVFRMQMIRPTTTQ